MARFAGVVTLAVAWAVAGALAQPSSDGPYKVLKTARVGGEGGWDYIYADAAGRRLYIPRGARPEIPATDTTPAVPAAVARIVAYNLDTLERVGEIPGHRRQWRRRLPEDRPRIFEQPARHLDVRHEDARARQENRHPGGLRSTDGIYCDSFNDRNYVFSHPTKNALVIDAKDGTVAGTIDLGGQPEQAVADGTGTLYVVMQAESNVAVVDVKAMKTTAHYDFAEKGGRCNGLALDVKNQVLFVACGNSSMTPAQGQPPQPTLLILSA